MVLEKTLGLLAESLGLQGDQTSQTILKEINPEYSLEELILKLKLQSFDYLMWRANSLEKTLLLGKIEDKRRRGWQRIRWLDGVTNSVDMSLSDGEAQRAVVHCVTESRTWLGYWTEAIKSYLTISTSQKSKWIFDWKIFLDVWKNMPTIRKNYI